ncbi:MAG: aminomethyl-transferring glycine dehydrogenase subunit GcvPA [Candidatus Calescibacterium sp.]|nr:aminomethyl-transferring glycine dehydrogenase subunit GcvPA [Candidatus Calescibacterium sp.]MCX7972218.1 aminomethyl-transferring glycine dehydrogenase subunit GcvPA [bacterium]MDW8195181.1 aminomethyl-transferring glycine dehydrogenase subunit GcvPA [Candidatus Calescibacterium sp.]
MYIPHTPDQIQKIKDILGIDSVDDIFQKITGKTNFFEPIELGEKLSQQELLYYFDEKLSGLKKYHYLVGCGAYDHFIPPVVDALMRSEFITSYTPYQPEISQGVLKAIWDFQSYVCEIFDMDVCNSSHYDGATAAAEAVLMAKRIYSKINPHAYKYIVLNSLHPNYIRVIQTYAESIELKPVFADFDQYGKADLSSLENLIDNDTFAIVIQNPNFWGVIENNIDKIKELVKQKIVILVTANPFVYFLIDPPKVDIVAASLQPFGIPLNFGGPYIGVIATSMENIRNLPGRIIGQTIDKDGKIAYTMILQTREQHIRREKATSNICTNQGLMAIRNLIYLMTMGKSNLIKVAKKNYTNIRFFISRLKELGIAKNIFEDIFNEALIYVPSYTEMYNQMKDKYSIILGVSLNKLNLLQSQVENLRKIGIDYDLKDLAIICTTEKYSKQQLDQFCNYLKEIC